MSRCSFTLFASQKVCWEGIGCVEGSILASYGHSVGVTRVFVGVRSRASLVHRGQVLHLIISDFRALRYDYWVNLDLTDHYRGSLFSQ